MMREIIINENYPGLNPVICGYDQCSPASSFGPHIRSYWLFHYVLSGCGTFRREGKTHHIATDDIFVIPPYVETFYQADKNNPWQYIWIGFTADMPLPAQMQEPVIHHSNIGQVFKEALKCHEMENGKSAYLCSCLWKIMSFILEENETKTNYIEKAINCIHSEYMNNITVADISQRLNLDRSYFSTLFKDRVGVSPSQYIINYRLEKAAELIKEYNESPTSAALSCGYTDICHFSKAFKKKYGCAPTKYK